MKHRYERNGPSKHPSRRSKHLHEKSPKFIYTRIARKRSLTCPTFSYLQVPCNGRSDCLNEDNSEPLSMKSEARSPKPATRTPQPATANPKSRAKATRGSCDRLKRELLESQGMGLRGFWLRGLPVWGFRSQSLGMQGL